MRNSIIPLPRLTHRSFTARYWETVTRITFHGRKNLKYMRVFTFCSGVLEVFVLEYCATSKDSFVNAVSWQRVFFFMSGTKLFKK